MHWLQPPIQRLIEVARADVYAFFLILERKYLLFLIIYGVSYRLKKFISISILLRILL